MGLIDADELKKELYQQWFMDILLTQRNSEDMFYALAKKIDEQPTAYDVDKAVTNLEKQRDVWNDKEVADKELVEEKRKAYNMAIAIVKGGGVDEMEK